MKSTIAWSCTLVGSVGAVIILPKMLGLVFLPLALVALFQLWSSPGAALAKLIPQKKIELIGPAILLSAAVFSYGRLLLADMPVNHDHPVMLLRAWTTGSQFLASGSLTGYSETMFGGYPANSLYPMGTDLLVCATKGISLGLFSWERAYCLALFLAVLAYPMSLYAMGRRFAGPSAGLVAGLLGLYDRGTWFQSGWEFNLNWGVWSMGLSFSMCLFTFVCLDRLIERFSPARFCSTAFCVGFAILLHPMALAILGVTLPIYFLVMVASGKIQFPGQWFLRASGSLALGTGLALFWLLPFWAHQEWFEPLAYPWIELPQALSSFMSGTLLKNLSPAFLILGLAGLLLNARRTRPFSIFLLSASSLLVFLASNSFFLLFDALSKFPALSNLQPERFLYFVRSALLIGCGLFVHHLLLWRKHLSQEQPEQDRRSKKLLWQFILASAATPLLLFAPQATSASYFAPLQTMSWSSGSARYGEIRELADYLNQIPDDEKGRIAVIASRHDHQFLALPVHTGLPIFKIGFTPENNYRYKFESRSRQVWKAVKVSHVATLAPLGRPDVEEIKRFGKVVLHRFKDFSKERLTIRGVGQAQVVLDEPEAMDIKLSNTTTDSKLIVYLARYALWSAELNGKRVPIQGATVGDSPPVFMELPAEDGVLRLRYRSGVSEWIGGIVSLLSWGIWVLILVCARWDGLGSRLTSFLSPRYAQVKGKINWITTIVLGVGLLILLLRLFWPAALQWQGRSLVSELSHSLPQAQAEIVKATGKIACQPYDGSGIQCPGEAWNKISQVIQGVDQKLRKCIWLHPMRSAKLMLHFNEVTLGDKLEGNYGLSDSVIQHTRKSGVSFSVFLDGQELGQFTCPVKRGWHSWSLATPGRAGSTGRVSVQVHSAHVGNKHFCFTAYSTIKQN